MAAGSVEEVVEEVVEEAGGLSSRDVGLLLGGAGVGVALGFAGGYFFLRKRMELKYEALADVEIEIMRDHNVAKMTALQAREEKNEKIDVITEELGYSPKKEGGNVAYHQVGSEPEKESEDPRPPVGNVSNIFNHQGPVPELDEEWDYDEEMQNRSPQIPYVIHRDEYTEGMPNSPEWEQHTLTYFEGDDVLSDERDQVVEDQDEVVGLGNLSKFGHGSGDPNIVYIRNHEMKVDIELVHSDGKYATEVHGFQDDELQHSSMKRRSPRRSDYDSSD